MLSAKLIAYLTLVVAVATVAHDVSATALDPKEPSLADALPVSRTHVSSQGRILRTRDSDTVEDADKVEDPDAAEDVDTVEDADTIEDSNTVDDSSERLLFRMQSTSRGPFVPPKQTNPSSSGLIRKRRADPLPESLKKPRTETSFLPSNGGEETPNIISQLDKKFISDDVEAGLEHLRANHGDLPKGPDPDDTKWILTTLLSVLDPKRHRGVPDVKTALARGDIAFSSRPRKLWGDEHEKAGQLPRVTRDNWLADLKKSKAIVGGKAKLRPTLEKELAASRIEELSMSSKFDLVEKLSRDLQAAGYGKLLQLTDDKVNYLLTSFKDGKLFMDIGDDVDAPVFQIFWAYLRQWDRTAVERILWGSIIKHRFDEAANLYVHRIQQKYHYFRPEISTYIDEGKKLLQRHQEQMKYLEGQLKQEIDPKLVDLHFKSVTPANDFEKKMVGYYKYWYRKLYDQVKEKKLVVLD